MKRNIRKPIKGIRIKNANFAMILVSCILYILLISATIHASRQYHDVQKAMDTYIACGQCDTLLTSGSAYLTEQARLYVVTAKAQYMDQYFTEVHTTKRRETAVEELKAYYDGNEIYSILQSALEESNKLMVQEIYAMKLVAVAEGEEAGSLPEELKEIQLSEADMGLGQEGMRKKAQDMVFGSEYQGSKEEIAGHVSRFMDSIQEATSRRMGKSADNLEATMSRQRILVSILFIESIITFIMIILLIVKPLQVYVKCIREDKMMEITGSYEFKYLALTYNDIYEVNATNEAMLRYQAEHDPLTGIINRGAFDQLKQIFHAKSKSLGLLIIDVDKFKLVNDGYGHEMGDQILKRVAKLLEESFRATDYPARIGGDEFAVILTNVSENQKDIIEGKIAHINDCLLHPPKGMPRVTLSVGGAFSDDGFTDDLYRKADLALYDVKEHGRCGCRFYDEGHEYHKDDKKCEGC
ncbi:MAG: GGDEF domain-containing protein [Lachnospiraceae bacterium]|jgi:diguanylate cyclase (GGDEF)-like protein|nr:GGDEF domain-containing protein [Lachnospiraceae bacterium]